MNSETIHILLADDDEDDRLFFNDAINQLNIRTNVATVENGKELMEYLLDPNYDLPHVLFLDLNMPFMSGYECLYQIRNNELLSSLTVAIYSTSSSESDIEDSFVNGANVYIKKPNDFENLKLVLNKVISTNWQYFNNSMKKENFLLIV
jgi:CheY-like chemotaxis protein